MNDNLPQRPSRPKRPSSYAKCTVDELHAKLETHKRMIAAIEAELQRRKEAGDDKPTWHPKPKPPHSQA